MIDPFTAWTRMAEASASMAQSAWRLSETMTASGDVIDRRTAMMRSAMADPLNANTAELGRMVPEKIAAFSTAGNAMMAGWLAWNEAVLEEMRHLMLMAARGRMATPADWMALWSRGASFGIAATERSARTGAAALRPVHAKATSNARRLARTAK